MTKFFTRFYKGASVFTASILLVSLIGIIAYALSLIPWGIVLADVPIAIGIVALFFVLGWAAEKVGWK